MYCGVDRDLVVSLLAQRAAVMPSGVVRGLRRHNAP